MRAQRKRRIGASKLRALALGWLALSATPLRAQQIVQTARIAPFPNGQLIRGSEGSAAAVIELPEGSSVKHPALLSLQTAFSDSAIGAQSTLTAELDEVPFFATHLAQPKKAPRKEPQNSAPNGQSTEGLIPLPPALPGYHILRIRSRLVTPGDPCTQRPEQTLWLRILATTELRTSRRVEPTEPHSVASLLSTWMHDRAKVNLAIPETLSHINLTAALAADALLRSLGVRPQTGNPSLPQLRLRTDLASQPKADPLVAARLAVEADSLTLSAAGDRELLQSLYALRSQPLWNHCDAAQCELSASDLEAADPAPQQDKLARERSPALVRTLRDLGYDRGHLSKGEGQHVFSFTWLRPSAFEVSEWPTLRLTVHRSRHPALDPAASSIEVHLSGQSLGRFSLQGDGEKPLLLSAEVPRAFFAEDSFRFEIVTTLISAARPPKCVIEPSALWSVISADSGLFVPRKEQFYPDSLAAFWKRTDKTTPRLILPAALPRSLLPQLGSVLAAFDHGRRFLVDQSTSDCGGLCIEARIMEHKAEPKRTESLGTALAIDRVPKEAPKRLIIWLREDAHGQPDPETPDVAAIITPQAQLAQGRWLPQGETGKPGKETRVRIPHLVEEDGQPVPSDRQQERQRIDLLWAMLMPPGVLLGWLFVQHGRHRSSRGARS